MSREIDATVLVSYAFKATGQIRFRQFENIQQGLESVKSGKKKWNNGVKITKKDIINLYSSEIFINLGDIMINRLLGEQQNEVLYENPQLNPTLEVIDEVSPYNENEIFNSQSGLALSQDALTTDIILPGLSQPVILKNPTLFDELNQKWGKAMTIYERRGTVPTKTYNLNDVLEGLKKQNKDVSDIPREISIDEEGEMRSRLSSLRIVESTGAKPSVINIPFYTTFSEENGATMLSSVLEDLQEIKRAITDKSK